MRKLRKAIDIVSEDIDRENFRGGSVVVLDVKFRCYLHASLHLHSEPSPIHRSRQDKSLYNGNKTIITFFPPQFLIAWFVQFQLIIIIILVGARHINAFFGKTYSGCPVTTCKISRTSWRSSRLIQVPRLITMFLHQPGLWSYSINHQNKAAQRWVKNQSIIGPFRGNFHEKFNHHSSLAPAPAYWAILIYSDFDRELKNLNIWEGGDGDPTGGRSSYIILSRLKFWPIAFWCCNRNYLSWSFLEWSGTTSLYRPLRA